MLYFTHLPSSPQWMDFYQIWYRRSHRGRNQLCGIFCRSVQVYWFSGGLKFAYPHRNWRSPLTLSELPFRLWWPTNRKSYMIYPTAPFSMTLNDPYLQFQGHAILWRWISHKRFDIHSFNEILIGTYTRPTQQCHFKWPWVTVAKYSKTRSIARSLCDSWASC